MALPGLYVDLPLMGYEASLELQRAIVAAKKEKRIQEDVILILEHPPVFTLGRNGGEENLVASEELLKQRGIKVVQIERGGNITYHGPGQLVAYPILDLKAACMGVRDLVEGLEAVMVQTASEWGIEASGHPKNRGVWIGSQKLGSIGITVSRSISFHGLALNVNTDLEPFNWINPCGFHHIRMTSMKEQLSKEVDMATVRPAMKTHMEKLLDKELVHMELAGVRKLLNQGAS